MHPPGTAHGVERAVWKAAPDLVRLETEEPPEAPAPAPGFVPLSSISRRQA